MSFVSVLGGVNLIKPYAAHNNRVMSVRFAPSPTGRFHLGNLRSAWISQWWADRLSLPHLIRFEDIDGPRVLTGAQELQIADMERIGVRATIQQKQSDFHDRHWRLFREAVDRGWIYPCFCSRSEVQQALKNSASAPHESPPLYSGHCRELHCFAETSLPSIAWRLKMAVLGGRQDFIVARTPAIRNLNELKPESFVPAYNWACAVDDYDAAPQLLVRAWDLEDVIPQQRAVHDLVARMESTPRSYPAVFHSSLITQNSGARLEKRTQGVTLPELEAHGCSSSRLMDVFAESFNVTFSDFAPQKIFGEAAKKLTLSELGLESFDV